MKKKSLTVTFTKTITRCYYECPYFGLDGGPGAVMVCNHPDVSKYSNRGYIITRENSMNGFPDECPLLKEK